MLDLAPNVPWLLAWVLVPLILVTWLILGGWHCFTSDQETGVLLLVLVVFAAWLTLFRWGYRLRLPTVSGHPVPQVWVLGLLLGWVVGFGGTALFLVDWTYRGDKNWLQEYAKRQRDAKRARRQQTIGCLGALQLLVGLLLLVAYSTATFLQPLIYSFALGTPLGVLLFLVVWRYREP